MTPNSRPPTPPAGPDGDRDAPVAAEYAGFWIRVVASLIDSVLVLCLTFPLLVTVYGWSYMDAARTGFVAGGVDILVTWVTPAVAVVAFWLYRQATPGKMALSMRVVTPRPATP